MSQDHPQAAGAAPKLSKGLRIVLTVAQLQQILGMGVHDEALAPLMIPVMRPSEEAVGTPAALDMLPITDPRVHGTPASAKAMAESLHGMAVNLTPSNVMTLLNGGHAIQRHVGRTPDQLKERLKDEPHIAAASSFLDIDKAVMAITEDLKGNASAITNWISTGKVKREFDWDTEEKIGISVIRDDDEVYDCTEVRTVLKVRWGSTGTPFFILTAFPFMKQ